MGFFLSLLIFFLVDSIVGTILFAFGVDPRFIDIILSLILAFIFAYANSPRPALKQLTFHKNFSFTFIVLLVLRYIFRYV
jgi:uncharacterized membrane protein YphA (DoxX/SURF4 family)